MTSTKEISVTDHNGMILKTWFLWNVVACFIVAQRLHELKTMIHGNSGLLQWWLS
jgi:hypothetical protein